MFNKENSMISFNMPWKMQVFDGKLWEIFMMPSDRENHGLSENAMVYILLSSSYGVIHCFVTFLTYFTTSNFADLQTRC